MSTPTAFGINSERLVLCIPRGGLNDTLCQIELCREYAQRFSRTLVLDTTKSGLLGQFDELFAFRTPVNVMPRVTPGIIAILNKMETRPDSLRGRIGGYGDAPYLKDLRNHVDATTQKKITFDLSQDHEEQLLVHEQCGGGTGSTKLLAHLTLSEPMKLGVDRALATLPAKYIGLHIRNTDYKTDYIAFVDNLSNSLEGQSILVCSDDPKAIAYCRNSLSKSSVFTVTEPKDLRGSGLHMRSSHPDDESRRAAAQNSIVDLIALGSASDVLFANVAQGYPSGFSRLAKFLCDNKSVSAHLRGQSSIRY